MRELLDSTFEVLVPHLGAEVRGIDMQ